MRRPPLPLRERAIAVGAALQVAGICWALGGMRLGPQFTQLGISLLLGALLFIPIREGHTQTIRSARPGENLRRLLRFPPFWLGILLFSYITIQGFNPAWDFVTDGNQWWMERLDPIAWLPTGMRTPLIGMSPWRMLLILIPPWILACAVGIGIRRRRALVWLAAGITLHAALWGGVAIAQRTTGATEILWRFPSGNRFGFVGTFVSPNHAGAYVNLLYALATGLALHWIIETRRRLRPSGPHLVVAPVIVLLLAVQVLTDSRAAWVIAAALALILAVIFAWTVFVRYRHGGALIPGLAALCLAGALGAVLWTTTQSNYYRYRFSMSDVVERTIADMPRDLRHHQVEQRLALYGAVAEMARDGMPYGWGAGSFRYFFPVYRRDVPELQFRTSRVRTNIFRYAHNDYLQIGAELGIVGGGILAGFLLYGFGAVLARFRRISAPALCWIAGTLGLLAHAAVDFPLYNPAILTLFTAMLILAVQWGRVGQRTTEAQTQKAP